MSILTEIIDIAREKQNVDSTQYSDTIAISDLNDGYLEMCQSVIDNVEKRLFWDYGKTDINIGQNEYLIKEFEVSGSDNLDINKIDRVLIKVNDKYEVLPGINSSVLEKSDEYYSTGSAKFYTMRDNSIFIFPTPTEDIIDGLKIESQQTPRNLTVSDELSDIQFPRQYIKGLKYYLIACIAGKGNNVNEEDYYLNKFRKEKLKLIKGLNGKTKRPVKRLSNTYSNFM